MLNMNYTVPNIDNKVINNFLEELHENYISYYRVDYVNVIKRSNNKIVYQLCIHDFKTLIKLAKYLDSKDIQECYSLAMINTYTVKYNNIEWELTPVCIKMNDAILRARKELVAETNKSIKYIW